MQLASMLVLSRIAQLLLANTAHEPARAHELLLDAQGNLIYMYLLFVIRDKVETRKRGEYVCKLLHHSFLLPTHYISSIYTSILLVPI